MLTVIYTKRTDEALAIICFNEGHFVLARDALSSCLSFE